MAREKLEIPLEALEKTLGVVSPAGRQAGIDRGKYYVWYNTDPKFRAQVESLQDVALDFAESQLHKQISDGTPASTIFYLKTKGKNRGYVERQEVEVNGNNVFNVRIIDTDD